MQCVVSGFTLDLVHPWSANHVLWEWWDIFSEVVVLAVLEHIVMMNPVIALHVKQAHIQDMDSRLALLASRESIQMESAALNVDLALLDRIQRNDLHFVYPVKSTLRRI